MTTNENIGLTSRSPNIESKLRRWPCLTDEDRCTQEDGRAVKIKRLFVKAEEEVLGILNSYIHNVKEMNDPTCKKLAHDDRGYSALHLAAERNFLSVAQKLLESDFDPLTPTCNEGKKLALHIAIEKGLDTMAALLLSFISSKNVRSLFLNDATDTGFRDCKLNRKDGTSSDDKTGDLLTLNYLIICKRSFEKTLHAVLDRLKVVGDNGLATVYVNLLEEDGNGLDPMDADFNDRHRTVFQNLMHAPKDVANHPVIRVLIEHKWNMWARGIFVMNFCMYLVSLFSLTFSIVTAVDAEDVLKYDNSLQVTRGVFEIIVCIYALYRLCIEIWQMKRHKLEYWKQFFNWVELLSSLLVLAVIITRFTTEKAHWFILAVVYILWMLRIFKYAAVSSHTDSYAESLRFILTKNLIPFSLLFIVVNVAYGGVFLLVLKGEGDLHVHEETSSIFDIWFVGLRTLIEAQPIVEYTGSDGYGTAGIIVMIVFLTMTIVVLLNILIAQLSDTYSKIQSDAAKHVMANRVAIITRLEQNNRKFLFHLLTKACKCRQIKWVPDVFKSSVTDKRRVYYKSEFTDIDINDMRKSYDTQLEDIEARIQELRGVQIKTDLKAQTLKSRLRYNSTKIDEINENICKIMELLQNNLQSNSETNA